MPAIDPLVKADLLILNTFLNHAGVRALIPAAKKIQAFDQRFNTFRIEAASHAGYRLWIVSPKTKPDFNHTNSSYRFVFEYQIGVAAGTESRADLRLIEGQAYSAIAHLCEYLLPDGNPLNPETVVAPGVLDGVKSGDFDMEEDMFGVVQEFKGIARIDIAVVVPKSAMLLTP